MAQRDATIAALQQQVAAPSEQVAALLAQVARLSKNSSNSSQPPSSDIVKPPPPPLPPGEQRSLGGQKGHPRHEREPFTPAQIDRVVDYRMGRCPACGGPVQPLDQTPRKIQQVEISEVPVEITEIIQDMPDGTQQMIHPETHQLIEVVPTGERCTKPGYELCTLVPSDPARVQAVQTIFTDYIAGIPIRAIRRKINAMGLRTNRGQMFTHATIHGMLRNPAYTGTSVYSQPGVNTGSFCDRVSCGARW